MFLIDPEGTIVYTVFKETDFSTNFINSAYKESNLAAVLDICYLRLSLGIVKDTW
jgi:hypothetical protein